MTDTNDARETLYDIAINSWAPPTSTPPVALGNEDFDATGVGEWARFTVRHTGGGQESLGSAGNRKFLRRGLAMMQLFCAVDKGLQRLDALQKAVLDVFEARTVSGVHLHDGDYRELPPEDGYNRGTVTVQFFYEQQK